MTDKLKMAVIGVGALGRHHARILSSFDHVELVAVADLNEPLGQQCADNCNTKWVADYHQLLDEVHAACIAVPTTYHNDVATDCIEHGLDILIEKPLASTLAEAEHIVELAEKHAVKLQVGHVERFNPATEVAWKHCSQPKYIRAERISPYAFRSTDIGVVHDLMIHDLDLILDLVKSPIRHVDAFGVSVIGSHEDAVQARFQFENGCIADLVANRVSPKPGRTMQIWSASGCVNVDFTSREVIAYGPAERLLHGQPLLERAQQPDTDIQQLKAEVFGSYIKVVQPEVSDADALTAELLSFVESVQKDQTPAVDGQQALAAMQAAQLVLNRVTDHQWEGHSRGAIGPVPIESVKSALKIAG